MPNRTSIALRELSALLGREESMHSVHAAILRACHSLSPVVESGAMLAACSDEFNGELRGAFDRDVARQLSAPGIPGTRRVFSSSNLGGRIEPGATLLANAHFTARSATEGEKLLLIEVTGHVGRRETPEGVRWGELDRFGTPSPCCGALRMLLDSPPSAAAVRYPWFDQLTAFLGPTRLAALREDSSPHAMLRAAIVHAVLQSETSLVDLLRDSPATATHVLLVALVVVNRRGTDDAILVALHHLRFVERQAEFLAGRALRSTPEALEIDASKTRVRVHSSFPAPRAPVALVPAATPVLEHLRGRGSSVAGLIARTRRMLDNCASLPDGPDVYSRPLLRGFLQSLGVEAPELAVAALALEEERGPFRARPLAEIAPRSPSGPEARRALHDLEPSLQQLQQREARELLEVLLSERHPVLGLGR